MDRRKFVVGTVAGASALTFSACGGGSSDAATPVSGGPAPAPVPTPAPAPTPAPVPLATLGQSGKYRYQSQQLFQTARAASEPSHLPGGSAFDNEGFGPTNLYIDRGGWPWDNNGGDWLDVNRVRQGSAPWFSILANAASGDAAVSAYSADCTQALKFIQEQDRWNAFVVRCPVIRAIAGVFSTTQPAPSINVTYSDGSSSVLKCLITAKVDGSTAGSMSTLEQLQLPVFIEFERPTKPVQLATLHLTVTQHRVGANPVIGFFVLDPTVNTAAVEQGIAGTAPLDAGLVGHPSVIGVHRYVDGAVLAAFTYKGDPISSESSFDPAIYNNGATNLARYPHVGLGKWINPGPQWSMVNSSYAAEGFTPLAPGMGALRVPMPFPANMSDGFSTNGYAGSGAAGSKIFMPEPLYGNLDHIFTRHYMMIGTPNGSPYRMPIAKRFQMRQDPTSPLIWADCAGKVGIMPSHTTTDGGVSGSSGGGYGWQMRDSWKDCTANESGPDVEGWTMGLHTYDFGVHNPAGYRYDGNDTAKDTQFSQRGGMGVFYANRWYCMESEVKLNTVMPGAPGFLADGEIRVWVDGRLAFERKGMVMRSLPLMDQRGPNPVYRAGYIRPCRTLGVTDLWFNWYHGGVTQSTLPRTMFVTGLVWGTKYIGPMKLGAA